MFRFIDLEGNQSHIQDRFSSENEPQVYYL